MLAESIALAAALDARNVGATPAPAPTESAAQPATSKRHDPCGGPQELLKKYLAASPCVFVLGQASLQMLYISTNVPANGQLNVPGSPASAMAYRHIFGYPGMLANIGVTRSAQIIIAFPSFSQINSSVQGTVAAGTTDLEFSYKQLVYSDPSKGILGAFLASYEAPTGSPGLAAPGPAYEFNPLINFALNRARTLAISFAFPVANSAISSSASSGVQRGWSFAPQAVPLWRSPGGTLLALVLRHDFSAHSSSLTINSAQLITRQFQLQATYGGVNTTFEYADPIEGVARVTGASYPRSFTVGLNYMMGLSDLPPR